MAAKKRIAGNWKMNGLMASLEQVEQVCAHVQPALDRGVDVIICPPATLLDAVSRNAGKSGVKTGGQDCHASPAGAHTGDISAHMLRDSGANYVILGHSERRADHGETSADVKAKAEAAIQAGLIAIICVGETQTQRSTGQAENVVLGQVAASLPSQSQASQIVVAYEPVWAIGTGLVPTMPDIESIHRAIRDLLAENFGEAGNGISILYGGSVNAQNAAEILSIANVDGALVGGASLQANSFLRIINTLTT